MEVAKAVVDDASKAADPGRGKSKAAPQRSAPGSRSNNKKAAASKGSPEGGAVPSSRVRVGDRLTAWREAQELYPVLVGPEPVMPQ